MEVTPKDEEPIFELATECEKLFDEQIKQLKDDGEPSGVTILAELKQRFDNWASYLGVFAESRVCLDRRLRHHVEIQDQVLRLLDIMEQNLSYLFGPDESPDRMEIEPADALQHRGLSIESLEAISGAIDRLSHLGIAIRQSSVRGQVSKARAYQQTFDFSSFEEVAYLALKAFYADASEELVEQLTRSMTETYRLFLHRKHRQRTLQAPRERPRTPPRGLPVIAEEPGRADGSLAGSPMDVEMPATPQESRKPATASPRGPPPVRQHRLPVPSEKPSSVDSQEVKKKCNKMLSPSIKGKAKSILVSSVDYPRPPKGCLKCQWCFSSLSADMLEETKWQQHVNEDHKPYVCISEKCSQPPRFAASSQWFQHMLTSHGRNWHREVHAPSSWACPLCFGEEITFSKPADLADHLGASHDGIFTDSQQVQAIVGQSRVRSTRPGDTCPLCCRSMEQENPSIKEKGKVKERRGSSSKQPFQRDPGLDGSSKRIKTEAGHSQPDRHGDGNPETTAAEQHKLSAHGPLLSIEAIASHIAGHLRSIMLLTQRMIETDVAMDVSADNESVSGGTDDDRESHVMSERDGDDDDDSERAPDCGSDKSTRSEAGREWEGRGDEDEDETATDDGADWSRIPNNDPVVDPANDPLKSLREAQTRKAAIPEEQKDDDRSKPGMRSVDFYSPEFRFYLCLLQHKFPQLSHKLATRIAATMQVREDRLRLVQADALAARRREREEHDRETRVRNPGRHPIQPSSIAMESVGRSMPTRSDMRSIIHGTHSELSALQKYPSRPRRGLTQDAVCPYCARVCTSDTFRHRRSWYRHVDVDIEPWVCISDECTEPFVYFSTFTEWRIHMEGRHSVTWYGIRLRSGRLADLKYMCPLRICTPFDSMEAYDSHVLSVHHDTVGAEDELPELVNILGVSIGYFVCPLCKSKAPTWRKSNADVRHYMAAHVGRHLKSLAFFCLRNLDQGSDSRDSPTSLSVGTGPESSRPGSAISLSAGTGPDFEEGAEPQQELFHKNMEYYEGLDSQEQELCHENADVGNWEFLKSVAEDGDAPPISASSLRCHFAEVQHQKYPIGNPNSPEAVARYERWTKGW